jgi:bifunctional non-homologous end joining protein LigD
MDLHARLRKIEVKKAPTATRPPARECRLARWVKPKLVAEIRFTGWTRDGMLRHPTFIALRSDKPASQIVRESAVEPRKI